ncbi:MAG TPA: hypothetical protein P5561_02495, partial [Candidatus Omnitrophota bacterium]|nr:hypothetical protein [Candidatus Omnitrophota bacterium]
MISWQTHSFKPWLRTVAFITVFVFTFTSVVWDGGANAYAAAAKPGNLASVQSSQINTIASLVERPDLPESYGTVKASFQGNRDHVVLHVQDAHINEEAQRNIANILRYFSEKYQLGLVNLEGASGELYTELFSFFPNKEARRNVADYFLKEGRLTGPEYLAIVEKPVMTLYGVEDKELYEENRQAYVDALQFKDRDEKVLAGLNKALEGVTRFVFSDEMRELIRRRSAFQEGGPELVAYVRYLVELGRSHNIALDEYPGMHSLLQLVDLEKQVDFEKAEKETDELINDLKRMLSREKLSRFLTNTVHFRMKKMKRAAYYGYLEDEIKGLSVTQTGGEDLNAKYANVIAYIRYMKLYDAIDVSIFDEIEFLEKTVKSKLLTTPEQVQLDHILRIYDIYSKMFDFTLTKQDAEFFYTYQDEFKSATFVSFLKPLMQKYHFTYGLPSQVEYLDQDLPRVERFYKAALERDQVLIERAVEKTLSSGQKISAIVTGGFHTPGIEKYLREKDISYIVVAPRITKTIDKKKESALYDAALRETPLPIEQVLSEAFLQPKSPVLNDPRFQLAAWRMILSEGQTLDFSQLRMEVFYFPLVIAETLLLAQGPDRIRVFNDMEDRLSQLDGSATVEEKKALGELKKFLAKFDPKSDTTINGNPSLRIFAGNRHDIVFVLHEPNKKPEVTGVVPGRRGSIPAQDGRVVSFYLVKGSLEGASIRTRSEARAVEEAQPPMIQPVSDLVTKNHKLMEDAFGEGTFENLRDAKFKAMLLKSTDIKEKIDALRSILLDPEKPDFEPKDILFLRFAYRKDGNAIEFPTLRDKLVALANVGGRIRGDTTYSQEQKDRVLTILSQRSFEPFIKHLLLNHSAEHIEKQIWLLYENDVSLNTYTMRLSPYAVAHYAKPIKGAKQAVAEPVEEAKPATEAVKVEEAPKVEAQPTAEVAKPEEVKPVEVIDVKDHDQEVQDNDALLTENLVLQKIFNAVAAVAFRIVRGQLKAALKNLEALNKNQNILDLAVTGAGKTIIGILTTYLWLKAQAGRKVFIATNSDKNAEDGARESQKYFTQADPDEPFHVGYIVSDVKGKHAMIWNRAKGAMVEITAEDITREAAEGRYYQDPIDYIMRKADAVYARYEEFQFYAQSDGGRHFVNYEGNRGKIALIKDEADQAEVTDPSQAIISGGEADNAKLLLEAEGVAAAFARTLRKNSDAPSTERKTNRYTIDDQNAKVTLTWSAALAAGREYKKSKIQEKGITFDHWKAMVESELTAHECFIQKGQVMGSEYQGKRVFREFIVVNGEVVPFSSDERAMYGMHLQELQNPLREKAGLERQAKTKTVSRMSLAQMSKLPAIAGSVLMTATGDRALAIKYAATGQGLEVEHVDGLFKYTKEIYKPNLFVGNIKKMNEVVADVVENPDRPHLIDIDSQDAASLKAEIEAVVKARGMEGKITVEIYSDTLSADERSAVLARAGKPGHVLLIDATLTRGINVRILEQIVSPETGLVTGLTLYLTRIHTLKIIMDQLIGRVGREGTYGHVKQYYSIADLEKLSQVVSDSNRKPLLALIAKLRKNAQKDGTVQDWMPSKSYQAEEAGRIAAMKGEGWREKWWEAGSEQHPRNFERGIGLSGFESEIVAILDTILAEKMQADAQREEMDDAAYADINRFDEFVWDNAKRNELIEAAISEANAALSSPEFQRVIYGARTEIISGLKGKTPQEALEFLKSRGIKISPEKETALLASLKAAKDDTARARIVVELVFADAFIQGMNPEMLNRLIALFANTPADLSVDAAIQALILERVREVAAMSIQDTVNVLRSSYITRAEDIKAEMFRGSGIEMAVDQVRVGDYKGKMRTELDLHLGMVEASIRSIARKNIIRLEMPKLEMPKPAAPIGKAKAARILVMAGVNVAIWSGVIFGIVMKWVSVGSLSAGILKFVPAFLANSSLVAGATTLSLLTISGILVGAVAIFLGILLFKNLIMKKISAENIAQTKLKESIEGLWAPSGEKPFVQMTVDLGAYIIYSTLNLLFNVTTVALGIALFAIAIPGALGILGVSLGLTASFALIMGGIAVILAAAILGFNKALKSHYAVMGRPVKEKPILIQPDYFSFPVFTKYINIDKAAIIKTLITAGTVYAVFSIFTASGALLALLPVALILVVWYGSNVIQQRFFKAQEGSFQAAKDIYGDAPVRAGSYVGIGVGVAAWLAIALGASASMVLGTLAAVFGIFYFGSTLLQLFAQSKGATSLAKKEQTFYRDTNKWRLLARILVKGVERIGIYNAAAIAIFVAPVVGLVFKVGISGAWVTTSLQVMMTLAPALPILGMAGGVLIAFLAVNAFYAARKNKAAAIHTFGGKDLLKWVGALGGVSMFMSLGAQSAQAAPEVMRSVDAETLVRQRELGEDLAALLGTTTPEQIEQMDEAEREAFIAALTAKAGAFYQATGATPSISKEVEAKRIELLEEIQGNLPQVSTNRIELESAVRQATTLPMLQILAQRVASAVAALPIATTTVTPAAVNASSQASQAVTQAQVAEATPTQIPEKTPIKPEIPGEPTLPPTGPGGGGGGPGPTGPGGGPGGSDILPPTVPPPSGTPGIFLEKRKEETTAKKEVAGATATSGLMGGAAEMTSKSPFAVEFLPVPEDIGDALEEAKNQNLDVLIALKTYEMAMAHMRAFQLYRRWFQADLKGSWSIFTREKIITQDKTTTTTSQS